MHIEYAVTDPATGKARYWWDSNGGKFVANPFRVRQPGEKVPVSVIGETQIEHLVTIFQAPNGDWWIGFRGDLIGYYPASLFSSSMLQAKGCRVQWYGEVAWRRPPGATGWVKTEMGSGRFPVEGIPNVAYVRNPRYHGEWWTTVDAAEPSSVGMPKRGCFGLSLIAKRNIDDEHTASESRCATPDAQAFVALRSRSCCQKRCCVCPLHAGATHPS